MAESFFLPVGRVKHYPRAVKKKPQRYALRFPSKAKLTSIRRYTPAFRISIKNTQKDYSSFTTISGSISLSFLITSDSSPRRQVPP